MARLNGGEDVVVRGPSRQANRLAAMHLMDAVFGGHEEDQPHQGPLSLPHFHPLGASPKFTFSLIRVPRPMLDDASRRNRRKGRSEVLHAEPAGPVPVPGAQIVADAAAAKWLQRAEAYRKRLLAMRSRLPLGVRRLMRSMTLHDANLITVNHAAANGRSQLFLSFRLAGKGGKTGVQLRYDRVKALKVLSHDGDAPLETEIFTLYDEFDLMADGTLTHSILLTGGLEIRVRFTNLFVTPFVHVVALGRGRADIDDLAALAAS